MKSSEDTIDPIGANTLSIIAEATAFNRWMYDEIKPWLYGQVLELGSGIGNISVYVLQSRFKTVLSDINPSYTQLLEKRFSGNSNLVNIVSIDLQHPHFQEQYGDMEAQFDSIFLLNVIEHLENDVAAIKNCNYLLKPGGHLTVLAPAYPFLYCVLDKNLGHYRRYTKHKLTALICQHSFSLLAAKYFNLAGIAGWLIWGKLFRRPQLGARSFGTFNQLVPLFRMADKLVFQQIGLSTIVVGKKLSIC